MALRKRVRAKTGGRTPRKRPAGAPSGIRVRMYRQGLGDCFLITIPRAPRDFHMLVDCGVILGTSDPGPRMQAVAKDIAEAVGGGPRPRIDVVVATHQHWDHLSGFKQARALFDAMQFDEIWFAWTEDPQNALANRLRKEIRRRKEALRAALASPRAAALGARNTQGIRGILDSFGAAAAGAELDGTEEALHYLKQRKDARIRYRRPGEPALELPDVKGVRVYVLGPPMDETLIKKSDPTKRGAEVYEIGGGLTPEISFAAALFKVGGKEAGVDLPELTFPFESSHRTSIADARRDPYFRSRYGFGANDKNAWRRIDSDWLGTAGELALALDGDTNNTSLAIAIEIVADGRVILLPADAQVGNWESWSALEWKAAGGGAAVTGPELLRRTVLYKVGHHGSHNATLRAKGLELMESSELAAMIPVDHAMAVKKRWNMPFPPLFKHLAEKTRGRIMRIDDGVARKPATTTAADWAVFEKRVTETPLYIDYVLPL